MIKELKIKNIQSHKNTNIELSTGLNVFIGETDGGKSAILRALRYLFYNKPDGDSLISNWSDSCSITCITEEGVEYERSRSKNTNKYRKDKQVFEAFKRDIPEEIQIGLNITEINLQQQFDSHFLLSETSGKIALHFNKIAGLDIIDKSRSQITTELKSVNKRVQFEKLEIKKYKNKLKQLPDLKKLKAGIEELENLENTKQNLISEINGIRLLVQKIKKVQHNKQIAGEEILPEKEINIILDLYTQQEKINNITSKLNNIVTTLRKNNKKKIQIKQTIQIEKRIDIILSMYIKQKELYGNWFVLQNLYKNIRTTKKELKTKGHLLKILEKDYNKNLPKICPLCEQKIIKRE